MAIFNFSYPTQPQVQQISQISRRQLHRNSQFPANRFSQFSLILGILAFGAMLYGLGLPWPPLVAIVLGILAILMAVVALKTRHHKHHGLNLALVGLYSGIASLIGGAALAYSWWQPYLENLLGR